MDIFKSDKAPYILGLLVTLISWHVSQFVNEITQTRAVSYSVSIDRNTHEVTAEVSNVSRTKSLTNATFSLSCEGGDCLVPLAPPAEGVETDYGDVLPVPPNAIVSTQIYNSASAVTFTSTLAAGGRFDIVARLAQPDSRVQFYFIPDPEHPLDIYIFDRNSIIGFLVQNYLLMLVISFVACMGLLFWSIIFGFRSAASAPAPAVQATAVPPPAGPPPAGPTPATPAKKGKTDGS